MGIEEWGSGMGDRILSVGYRVSGALVQGAKLLNKY